MKIYKNGDRCPCCGQVLEGKSDDWLELFSTTVYFMGLSEYDPVDAEAMADIDRHEAEFGADGRRAFGGGVSMPNNNDLIRRGDAITELWYPFDFDRAKIDTNIRGIPAVDAAEEKQGFWKAAGTGHPKPGNQRYRKQDQWTVYKCSNCGASNGRNHSDPYCRHCGARMLVDNCRYCYKGASMDGEEKHNAVD